MRMMFEDEVDSGLTLDLVADEKSVTDMSKEPAEKKMTTGSAVVRSGDCFLTTILWLASNNVKILHSCLLG